jgi:hypothetical protein
LLKSHIEPTTSCVTVIQHIAERPGYMKPGKNALALRRSAKGILSLREADVACHADYEDLHGLTTYEGEVRFDVVVVFLEGLARRRSARAADVLPTPRPAHLLAARQLDLRMRHTRHVRASAAAMHGGKSAGPRTPGGARCQTAASVRPFRQATVRAAPPDFVVAGEHMVMVQQDPPGRLVQRGGQAM